MNVRKKIGCNRGKDRARCGPRSFGGDALR